MCLSLSLQACPAGVVMQSSSRDSKGKAQQAPNAEVLPCPAWALQLPHNLAELVYLLRLQISPALTSSFKAMCTLGRAKV